MRAVQSGNQYHIYDNSVSLFDNLPPQVYQIDFNPKTGYSLGLLPDITINEKIYGVHAEKVKKVLASYANFTRSLGVILSGDKGIGKSLFSKMLCQKAISLGYPVLICNGFTPGLAQFIESMDQELVVLFDEFDKTFKAEEDKNEQVSMLSLFDGVSTQKKLFCITCNNVRRLNNFLVNRPGRFHYHFRFEYPTREEIYEYMVDHIPEEKWNEISKICDFAEKVRLNFDCLRAIAFELQSASTFEEAISDLNILRNTDNESKYHCYLCFDDGTKMTINYRLDMFDPDEIELKFGYRSSVNYDYLNVEFSPVQASFSNKHQGFFVDKDHLKVNEISMVSAENSWFMKEHGDFINAHRKENVTGLIIRMDNSQNSEYRYFV